MPSTTLAEIRSQPKCWEECLAILRDDAVLEAIRQHMTSATEWLFVGCGTSYYIALSAAASFAQLTGMRTRAVAASELLLYPNLFLTETSNLIPVLISRSGLTSEVVQAAEYLENQRKIRCVSITCASEKPLELLTTWTLKLLPAGEVSTVMTRSFTSMLLGLQYLGAYLVGQEQFLRELLKLPNLVSLFLDGLEQRIQTFVSTHNFEDYVFLGQGPFFGVASECTLKVMEASCSYAQCFHTLEFRHGPKSVVSPRTLISFLVSRAGRTAELKLLDEIKELGGTTLAIADDPAAALRTSADLLVEVPSGISELARLPMYALPGQLLGVYAGLKKGLNPDQPANLSAVVVLDRPARENAP